jgi:hypothetical protein
MCESANITRSTLLQHHNTFSYYAHGSVIKSLEGLALGLKYPQRCCERTVGGYEVAPHLGLDSRDCSCVVYNTAGRQKQR